MTIPPVTSKLNFAPAKLRAGAAERRTDRLFLRQRRLTGLEPFARLALAGFPCRAFGIGLYAPADSNMDAVAALPSSIAALRDGPLKHRLQLILPPASSGADVEQIRAAVKASMRAHPRLSHDEVVSLVDALWAEPVHERRFAVGPHTTVRVAGAFIVSRATGP